MLEYKLKVRYGCLLEVEVLIPLETTECVHHDDLEHIASRLAFRQIEKHAPGMFGKVLGYDINDLEVFEADVRLPDGRWQRTTDESERTQPNLCREFDQNHDSTWPDEELRHA